MIPFQSFHSYLFIESLGMHFKKLGIQQDYLCISFDKPIYASSNKGISGIGSMIIYQFIYAFLRIPSFFLPLKYVNFIKHKFLPNSWEDFLFFFHWMFSIWLEIMEFVTLFPFTFPTLKPMNANVQHFFPYKIWVLWGDVGFHFPCNLCPSFMPSMWGANIIKWQSVNSFVSYLKSIC